MTARDDYPTLANHALGKLQFVSVSDAGAISAALDEIDRLRFEADSMRCVCDAAFTVIREDGDEDGWTAAWQELVSALEDARYEVRS